MKRLVIEWLTNPNAKEWWLDLHRQTDPLNLNFIAAAEEMAEEGYDCHIVIITNNDHQTVVLNRVQYHFRLNSQNGLNTIQQLQPDIILCSSDVRGEVVKYCHSICPLVWFVFHTDPQVYHPIPSYIKRATSYLPYQVAMLRSIYLEMQVEWYSLGVNLPVVTPYAKSDNQREWDMIFGGSYGVKGRKQCDEIAPLLAAQGLRIPPHYITGYLTKDDLFKLAGNTLYHFYPSILDGASRTLMECCAAGCRPIISVQSPPSLGLAPYINPIYIDGMSSVNIAQNEAIFDRSMSSIADELKDIVKAPLIPYRCDLRPMDAERHKNIIKKLLTES